MYVTYKLVRGTIKSLVSESAPWQIAIGTAIGTLLGFLPMFPLTQGPNPLWFGLLFLGLMINCHLGSLFLFLAIGKLLAKILAGPAVLIGMSCEGLAKSAADIPLLNLCHFSHTGYLGLTILGLGFAIAYTIVMAWLAVWFRNTLKPRLLAQSKLTTAGKLVDRPWLVRIGCWFMGL